MKTKSVVINKNNFKIKATDKNIINAFISVASGLMSGSLFYAFCSESQRNEIGELFRAFYSSINTGDSSSFIVYLVVNLIVFFFIICLLGTSLLGKKLIIVISIFKVSGISLISSYLYHTYNLQGLEYCLLVFYPGKVLFIFSLLLIVRNALDFSSSMLKKPDEALMNKNRYIITNLIFCVVLISSSIVDYIFLKLFSPLFSFQI